jgi:hypothetical protein
MDAPPLASGIVVGGPPPPGVSVTWPTTGVFGLVDSMKKKNGSPGATWSVPAEVPIVILHVGNVVVVFSGTKGVVVSGTKVVVVGGNIVVVVGLADLSRGAEL